MVFRFLLPHKIRFVGIVLFVLGLLTAYLRFQLGLKPEFLTLPVFAIYSSFLETKTFQFITNNVSEEIVAILLLVGITLINFSGEKEENQFTSVFRYKALNYSIMINTAFLFLSTLFIYGFAFINILMINLFSQQILFQIIFRTSLLWNKKFLRNGTS